MTKSEKQEIISAVLFALENAGKSPVSQPKTDRLSTKDEAILRGFKRKGIKNVVLMDRNDKSKPFNVRPFKAWLELGRVVKRNEHGVRGLFHESQTELYQPKAGNSAAQQVSA